MTQALELPRLCILTQDQAESSALEDISSHLQSLAQHLHSRIRSKQSHTSILERLKIDCSANLDSLYSNVNQAQASHPSI